MSAPKPPASEYEKNRAQYTKTGPQIIELQWFFKVVNREGHKDGQRDDFLEHFQLPHTQYGITKTVRGHLKYSKKAIPQLTSAAKIQGFVLRALRWAYHAKVMNTLLIVSRLTVIKMVGKGYGLLMPRRSARCAAVLGNAALQPFLSPEINQQHDGYHDKPNP